MGQQVDVNDAYERMLAGEQLPGNDFKIGYKPAHKNHCVLIRRPCPSSAVFPNSLGDARFAFKRSLTIRDILTIAHRFRASLQCIADDYSDDMASESSHGVNLFSQRGKGCGRRPLIAFL
jgi:hypothetical protein